MTSVKTSTKITERWPCFDINDAYKKSQYQKTGLLHSKIPSFIATGSTLVLHYLYILKNVSHGFLVLTASKRYNVYPVMDISMMAQTHQFVLQAGGLLCLCCRKYYTKCRCPRQMPALVSFPGKVFRFVTPTLCHKA